MRINGILGKILKEIIFAESHLYDTNRALIIYKPATHVLNSLQ